MVKLIVSDMDGTLLNSNDVISKGNQIAIKEALEQNIRFMIATGREYGTIQRFMKKFNLNCDCILMNGAEIRDSNGTIRDKINIPNNEVHEILNILREYPVRIRIFSEKGIYVLGTYEQEKEDLIECSYIFHPHYTKEQMDKHVYDNLDSANIHFVKSIDELMSLELEIRKIETFHKDKKLVETINFQLKKLSNIIPAACNEYSVEITNKNAQKGIMLEHYLKKIGINKEEVIVFGDGINDSTLFQLFPYSFAPENAHPFIKNLAYKIIDSNIKDGVGKTIMKIISDDKEII
jgi:hypothetical protein